MRGLLNENVLYLKNVSMINTILKLMVTLEALRKRNKVD